MPPNFDAGLQLESSPQVHNIGSDADSDSNAQGFTRSPQDNDDCSEGSDSALRVVRRNQSRLVYIWDHQGVGSYQWLGPGAEPETPALDVAHSLRAGDDQDAECDSNPRAGRGKVLRLSHEWGNSTTKGTYRWSLEVEDPGATPLATPTFDTPASPTRPKSDPMVGEAKGDSAPMGSEGVHEVLRARDRFDESDASFQEESISVGTIGDIGDDFIDVVASEITSTEQTQGRTNTGPGKKMVSRARRKKILARRRKRVFKDKLKDKGNTRAAWGKFALRTYAHYANFPVDWKACDSQRLRMKVHPSHRCVECGGCVGRIACRAIGKRCLRGGRPLEPIRSKVRVGKMRERLAIIGRGRNSGSYYRVNRIATGIDPRERGAPWPSGESDPRPRWVRFPAGAIEDGFSPVEEDW